MVLQAAGDSPSAIAFLAASVTDSAGRELKRFGKLRDVDAALAEIEDPALRSSVRWILKVDGKLLLGAAYPLTVTVKLQNLVGESTESSIAVDR